MHGHIHASLHVPVYCILTDSVIIAQCMGHLSEGMIPFCCTVISWLQQSVSPCFVTDSFINFSSAFVEYFTSSAQMNVFMFSSCLLIQYLLCEQEMESSISMDKFRWSMRLNPTTTANYSPHTWINVSAVIWGSSSSVWGWNYTEV